VSAPAGPRDGGHGDWDALAVGWALSTLESTDEARFAVHLPGCERCAGTVRESLHTVADLAYALPDDAPPPALKMRIMEAVRAEPRRRPDALGPGPEDRGERPVGAGDDGAAGPATPTDADWFARSRPSDPQTPPRADFVDRSPAARPSATGRLPDPEPEVPVLGSPAPVAGPGEPTGSPAAGDDLVGDAEPGRPDGRGRHALDEDTSAGTVVPFERSARRRWALSAAAAAVIALLAGLVAWNVRLRADQAELRQVVAQRSAEVAQRDALVAQRDAAIRQLTANGPARIAALVNPAAPTQPRRATVVVRGNQIEIITETLGASPANTMYWLWTLRCDGKPADLKPIRGFSVPEAKFSVRSIGSNPGFADASCFAISEELGTATPKLPRDVVAVGQPE
jgi:hypothetical protein